MVRAEQHTQAIAQLKSVDHHFRSEGDCPHKSNLATGGGVSVDALQPRVSLRIRTGLHVVAIPGSEKKAIAFLALSAA